jgi:hypothetical protein
VSVSVNSDGEATVSFSIDLKDAAAQKGTAVLYVKEGRSGSFTKVTDSGGTISYAGNKTGTWSPSPGFSSWIDRGMSDGAINWMRIKFSYKLPDGTTGTITSKQVPAWFGEYIGDGEGSVVGSRLTASFPLDTDLVVPSKVKGVSATLTVGSDTATIPASAISVSGDGMATVLCSLDTLVEQGVSLPFDGSSFPLEITLRYKDGDISWKDSATAYIRTPNIGSFVNDGTVYPLTAGTPDIGPEGFVAIFPLEESVVGDPTSYSGGESLTVESIYLVKNGTGTEISGNCTVTPQASPCVTVQYNAPSDSQLTDGDYRVEITLCYNSPTVTDLIDSGSASFSVSSSTVENPFGSGSFRYESGKSFSGSIELLNGADISDLSGLSFTVRDASGASVTVPSGYVTSGSGWIGFSYPEGAEPSLVAPATVTASATYGGTFFSSSNIQVTFVAPVINHGVSVGTPQVWFISNIDDTVSVAVMINAQHNTGTGFTYSGSVTSATVTWTIDGTSSSGAVSQSIPALTDAGDGTMSTGEFSLTFPSPSGSECSLVLSFTVQISGSNGSDTYSNSFTVTSGSVTVS